MRGADENDRRGSAAGTLLVAVGALGLACASNTTSSPPPAPQQGLSALFSVTSDSEKGTASIGVHYQIYGNEDPDHALHKVIHCDGVVLDRVEVFDDLGIYAVGYDSATLLKRHADGESYVCVVREDAGDVTILIPQISRATILSPTWGTTIKLSVPVDIQWSGAMPGARVQAHFGLTSYVPPSGSCRINQRILSFAVDDVGQMALPANSHALEAGGPGCSGQLLVMRSIRAQRAGPGVGPTGLEHAGVLSSEYTTTELLFEP